MTSGTACLLIHFDSRRPDFETIAPNSTIRKRDGARLPGVQTMVDVEDVRRIAASLRDVIADDATHSFRVGGTGFAWPYPERVHPTRARVPRLDIFVMRVAGEDD